jgi:hypothetical protein
MKLKRLVDDILMEGEIRDKLYHFTIGNYAMDIIKNNEISVTAAIGSKADLKPNRGRFFFFSLTRSKRGGYERGDTKIVFDKSKLKQRHKIIPIDYWGYSKKREDWSDIKYYTQALQSSEHEDRVISDSPIIKGVLKYIIAVHYIFDERYIAKMIDVCESNSIPLFVYKNREDFLNERHPINYDEYREGEGQGDDGDSSYEGRGPSWYFYRIASLISYKNEEGKKNITDFLAHPQFIENLEEELEKNSAGYFSLLYWNQAEALNIIMSDIHNIRSNPDKYSRFILGLLARDMKKNGASDIKSYLSTKQWKGKRALEDFVKEYVSHLFYVMENALNDSLTEQFDRYIEIGGTYYERAYESPEIIEELFKYLKNIYDISKTLAYKEKEDILRLPFKIYYEIEKKFNPDSISITDKIDITDLHWDYEKFGIDDLAKTVIKDVIKAIYREISYGAKSEKLWSEYQKQFSD